MHPESVSKSRQVVLWGLAVVLAGVVVLLLGVTFGVPAYLRSDRFRQLVGHETSQWLGLTEGEFLALDWKGFSAYSEGFAGAGADRQVRADRIRAELYPGGILRRTWQVRDLEIARLRVQWSAPGVEAAAGGVSGETGAARKPVRVGWWGGWAGRLELERARVEDLRLHWPGGALESVRAVATPEAGGWRLEGTGGQLRLGVWPAMGVQRVRARYREGELAVLDSELRMGDGAVLEVTGRGRREGASEAKVDYRGVDVASWLPGDWRLRLAGVAGGTARVTGDWRGKGEMRVWGVVELSRAQLQALPVLDRIAVFTQTAEFRRLNLQTARVEYDWTRERLVLREVVMEASGLLRLEGGGEVRDGRMDGVFELGVTPRSLRWLPGSQGRVFSEERAGYVWTTVRVSGPLNNLQEDLSGRLVSAAGEEVIEGVKGVVERGAQGLFELLRPLTP